MDAKRSILIVRFLHLIQEKRSKGRWKWAFMNNIFLMRNRGLRVESRYGGDNATGIQPIAVLTYI